MDITHAVENMTIATFHKDLEVRQVITVLKVIELIQNEYPNVTVINLGDPEFIVIHRNIDKNSKKRIILEKIKIISVCLICFFGAAFTIMTFNNDVGVDEVFSKLYELFMDRKPKGNTILQVGYIAGLTLGMLIFFNHLSKHRFSDEPTPLEVEMRLQERDVNDATAISAGRNNKIIDVD